MNVHEEYLSNLFARNFSNHQVIAEKHTQQQENDNEDSEKQRTGRVFNRERVNLEPHQLVWCDANIDIMISTESTVSLEDLRKIVDYTKLFDHVKECQQYLTQTTDSVTFLVCSGELGEKIIPEIHQLRNVELIYIYSRDRDHHQQWASNLTKVRLLTDHLRSLKDANESL